MNSESESHKKEVISQFTTQSTPFAELKEHKEERSLEIFHELGCFKGGERILDSGCGPGLVSCYLSQFVKEVTGVDLTPAMVDLAEETAKKQGLSNTHFLIGDMLSLPAKDKTFDACVSRYTFHHLEYPQSAFLEMIRVTKLGGKVIVVDATPEANKQDEYNAFEILRDSSHTKALTKAELLQIGSDAGLGTPKVISFGLTMKAEGLVNSSFPTKVTREHLLKLLSDDMGKNHLDFDARMQNGALTIMFPLTAFCWKVLHQPSIKSAVPDSRS